MNQLTPGSTPGSLSSGLYLVPVSGICLQKYAFSACLGNLMSRMGWKGLGLLNAEKGVEGQLFVERIHSAEPGEKARVNKEESMFLMSQKPDWFCAFHSKKESSLLWGLCIGFPEEPE